MKKLLVTGASGFLGWTVCQMARQQWRVYGTYFSHAVNIPGVTLLKVDVREFADVQAAIAQIQPDAVIHAAAQSQPNACQTQPEDSYRINVTAVGHIADLCAEAAIPCAFTSTDLVFDGTNAPYREIDRVCPISVYGEQKVQAEQVLRDRYDRAVICRMPVMFGAVPPTASSFIQPLLAKLRRGEEIHLFSDEFRTPVSGTTAARGLLLAIERNASGILHLGGPERISRYEFGLLMAEILNFPRSLVKPIRQADVKLAAPRPADVSLESSLAIALGYQTLSLREELELLKSRLP
jgi:dTDP-4-dehydrorhamnose reductase